jgi:formylglycine-generating enzyme required for sulfatase activity
MADAAAAGAAAGQKLKVFISYSRKDEDFARELVDGLQVGEFEPYLDRHDIAAGEDWEARLGRLIEAADAVVFIISPDSIASPRCGWETERAHALNKRVLPIVCRGVEEAQVPPRLKQLNYIFFDQPRSFSSSLLALARALRTDIGWVREHTRIGEAALRWDARGREEAQLFRGAELEAAVHWLKAQPKFAQEATLLHHEFIKAGQDAEAARTTVERQRLDQMAAAQAEREAALEREQAALDQARAGVRKIQRAQTGIGVLLGCLFIGMIGILNQAFIMEQINWYSTMRPYMLTNFRPHVLSDAAERALKAGQSFRECTKDCPEMVVVPAGSFMMGSPATEAGRLGNEGPQQLIEFANQVAVAKHPVTFAEWDACVAVNACKKAFDSDFGRGTKPVINVTWDQARQFAEWIALMTGQPYRLLTEAEFEFAVRAGTTTAFPWGDTPVAGKANCNGCGSRWGGRETAPVGSFPPNDLGLFDMTGNVSQWVQDCYFASLDGVPRDGRARTAVDCGRHTVRGGTWDGPIWLARSAFRSWGTLPRQDFNIGFRLARSLLRTAP